MKTGYSTNRLGLVLGLLDALGIDVSINPRRRREAKGYGQSAENRHFFLKRAADKRKRKHMRDLQNVVRRAEGKLKSERSIHNQ